MRLIGNLIWFFFGGLQMAFAWCVAGVFAAITIIGLPWARACFTIANFSLWPFGRQAVERPGIDIGTGPFGMIGNLIWAVFCGWWLSLGHLFAALACCITIIGIPFGLQHIKLAGLALLPIGKDIVPLPA